MAYCEIGERSAVGPLPARKLFIKILRNISGYVIPLTTSWIQHREPTPSYFKSTSILSLALDREAEGNAEEGITLF